MKERWREVERLLRDVLKRTNCCIIDTHIRAALFWLEEQCE
jgi:hypothetical protein